MDFHYVTKIYKTSKGIREDETNIVSVGLIGCVGAG